jgi:ribosomal protein S18 acetylase RimI-like enzyme
MVSVGRLPYLKRCDPSDDAFLYDVFCTTWQSEVAALPNQNLARHVLRIQHIAQERRFANVYPGHRRYVVTHEGERAGRLYLFGTDDEVHVLDLTLLPRFHDAGIEPRLMQALMSEAARDGRPVTVRVSRTDDRANALYSAEGFVLRSVDDVDHVFAWEPARALDAALDATLDRAPEGDALEARTGATRR